MKINDFIFRYKSKISSTPGICRARTFFNSKNEIYVVLSELDENPSTSVTNMIEFIVDQLINQNKIPKCSKIIDHYSSSLFYSEEFDLVTFDNIKPNWKSLNLKTVINLLECPVEEFDNYRNSEYVKKEIQDAINGIPKLQEFVYQEQPYITERRLEINSHQHSKSAVAQLLREYPNEQRLNEFLREDLSLVAECYANPEEEYICFAEFPIGEHRSDFALFTGRSRMRVCLIEIKGADKSLRRKNHYGDFRSSVQEGKGQLFNHSDWCTKNYEKFRAFTYSVLEEVKNGNKPYHAFPGPKYQLCVDPNKDIRISYILIAGRTDDDILDSKKRDKEERLTNVDMQIETWDSWLNKLTRV